MSPLVRRLLHLLGRSRHDAELQEEIETHRTPRQDAFERDGLAPEEAAYASRRALGNVALAARRGVVIGAMHVVLRTTRSLDEIAPSIRSVVRESDPTVPIVRLQEMDDVFRDSIRRPRLLSNTVNIFAGLALLISAIGIYGLLSYTVTLRRREIGVRMALGASRAWILAGILRWGLALVLIGTVTGVAAAIALSQSITSLLFGIAATDATTLIAVVAGVMTVGTLACLIPAWRASRVDPLLLIREN